MPRPENGIYIIQGEVNLLVTAMRRNSRWSSHTHQDDDQDPLLNSFSQLKELLNTVPDLDDLAPNEFLSPFLDVIRSEDTTGPITGLALTSVNKFLSYGLIDSCCETAAAAIENIADAVTHARFVGTDPGSDEVVLMKILHVLRTLMLTPAGAKLTNESVCEIMQSCFRICFEMRLSELLRKSAEHTLMDMVQLLFSRLPQFKEDPKWATSLKKLKMRTGSMDPSRAGKKKKSPKPKHKKVSQGQQQTTTSSNTQEVLSPSTLEADPRQPATEETSTNTNTTTATSTGPAMPPESIPTPPNSNMTSPDVEQVLGESETIATTPVAGGITVVDIHESFRETSDTEKDQEQTGQTPMVPPCGEEQQQLADQEVDPQQGDLDQIPADVTDTNSMLAVPGEGMKKSGSETELNSEADRSSYTSEVGDDVDSVQSMAEQSDAASVQEADYVNPRGVRFTAHQQNKEGAGPLIPYGLPCVRELFRFLISLTNPIDRHNTDVMIHMGLSLLTAALESGADNIASFNSLLCLLRDDMCKNLFFLLQSERLSLFAASVRVCFLLFESTRSHLKFQLEMYLTKLMDIIVSESPRILYEQREIALESVVQLCRIPGLVTELYLNYDCDLYCSNLFEDLTKLLSKNAFPVSGLFNTHLLSLDALLAVIDSIEQHCHHRVLNSTRPVTETDSKAPAITLSEELAKQSGEGKSETGSLSDGSVDASVPPPPPMSGYAMADRMGWLRDVDTDSSKAKGKDARRTPQIRPNRMKISTKVPTEEELIAIKHKKKVYQTGTEQFNVKPTKGIAFLQDQGLLSAPLDPGEVVTFLKENPKLDKKQIGEYLSNKKNGQVLEAYQKSFAFEDTRVDEALRMYLESFRLPGEAPVISYLLEHFADHWHKYNGEPFANADAAFTLSYAVIMLNVDQHNHNAKKQNIPMTAAEFKRNLSKVNGGQDFDEDMLDEVYNAVRNDEIVMPAEQTGLVRENYLWKVLLRRGGQKEGQFTHAPTGAFDRDLFSLVWGPTVAALSFVFDKSLDETIIQKAISGFRKCAMISAHYGLSDVFDNLVISLCKFTTLLSSAESPENIPIVFGNNMKAQLAARTVFNLAHRHGDILREGWKNILDCMLQLYRAKLLPEVLVKVEDFVDPSGRISLVKEDNTATQRAETGVLSSFYSYFTLAEPVQQRGPSAEEQESIKQAHKCIQDCHVEQLITESKFLRMDSLQELIKALIFASRYPEVQETMNGTQCDEEAAVLNLELLIRVVLQNRDRVGPFWQNVRDHLCNLIVNANEATLLVERAVVGLLRISIRLLRREEIAAQVLTSLRILLMMKPNVIHAVCRQVSFALHDLLRTNAANIHSSQDWYTLFTLLEVVGAGTNPPPILQVGAGVRDVQESISDAGAQSDSELSSSANTEAGERGYTSDSELYEVHKDPSYRQNTEPVDIKPIPSHGSWLLQKCILNSTLQYIHVNREDLENGKKPQPVNQYNIVLNEELRHHDTKSLMKSCETLAFLVRDAAHVTPHNFESCVHCIRTFVEASIHGGRQHKTQSRPPPKDKRSLRHRRKEETRMKKSKSSPSHLAHHLQDSDEEVETDGYHSLSIQLLDLMHTLHTRAATIFSSWAEEERHNREPVEPYLEGTIDAQAGTLWLKCWSPLLQGIARLCCDTRRIVRSQALTYLQRALLVHDLQTLSAVEWESCFNKVLFPLLHKLLDNINVQDPGGIEETRMRASTLLCKVFLQHLSPLLSLSTFTALWLTILEFMDKYMHADKSDLLCEAIPESLKNMLLVMHTAGILQTGEAEESQLWKLTWDRIDTFLPTLRVEVFKPHELEPRGPVMRDSGTSADTQPSPAQPPPTQSAPSPPRQTQSPARVSTPVQEQPVRATQPDANDAPKNGEVGRCGSPLNAPDHVPKTGPYILHTPLPSVTGPSKDSSLTSVPILLNPDIMQSTTVPFISPQGTPERKAEVVSEGP